MYSMAYVKATNAVTTIDGVFGASNIANMCGCNILKVSTIS